MNKLGVLEGILFVVGEEGITLDRICNIMEIETDEAKTLLKELQKSYENLCKQYKKSFLKDIEIFNKEDLEKEIKFGLKLKTPHYTISFSQSDYNWKAEITDLHKSKCFVAVSLYKEDVKTVKQALDDISDTIVEYEFENKFKGVG